MNRWGRMSWLVVGVICGGLLVWLLDSRWPDLLIGTLISLVILKGAQHIIRDARQELAT